MSQKWDYHGITEYYLNILTDISNIIYTTKEKYDTDSLEYEEIDKNYLYDWYTSKEKAYYRTSEILDMSDYYNCDDFEYWALEKWSEARHRIQGYLEEDASPLLDFSNIEYQEYDDIVMDYYQPIRLSEDKEIQKRRRKSFDKYSSIYHRRVMLNLGLINDIKDVRESVEYSNDLTDEEKNEQYRLLDKIHEYATRLNGYSYEMENE